MNNLQQDIFNVFNGQTPIKRQNPKPGESQYYYINPNQGNVPFSELKTTDIPDGQMPYNIGQGINQNQQMQQTSLELANNIKQTIPQNLENSLVMANQNLSPWQKIGQMAWNNFSSYNPIARMGETLGTLQAAKQEMEQVKKPGYDNYAHRYGMYTNAQDGLDKAAYTLGMGAAKEIYDFGKKVVFNRDFWSGENKFGKLKDTIRDSYKDMQNNYEAVKSGLQNQNLDGRLWLSNFDYENNEWIK